MIEAGAAGYVNNAAMVSEFLTAIRMVLAGEFYLTPAVSRQLYAKVRGGPPPHPHDRLSHQEFDLLRLIGFGMTTSEIGELMCRSEKTVSQSRAILMKKLGLATQIQLLRYAIQHKIV
jgi:DNA-binding NarL/FixJ family response regulator